MALGKTIASLVNVSTFGLISKGSVMNAFGGGGNNQGSSPQPMPQAPSPVEAAAKAEDVVRKKRAAATQTIYTSPLGVAGEAQVARKTLLGQ